MQKEKHIEPRSSIQAAINGSRSIAEHRHVPLSAEKLAKEAILATRSGASSIHFHVTDLNGKQSLDAKHVHRQVAFLRSRMPGIPLGISTGAWIVEDFQRKTSLINSWQILPDFVSVNADEKGFETIINACKNKGMGIEVGLSGNSATQALLQSGLLPHCFRILVEPQQKDPSEAIVQAEAIIKLLAKLPAKTKLLVHGKDQSCWEVLLWALENKYDTRIGFEDTLIGIDGRPATSNAALVKQALSLAGQLQK